jgi:orotidine-5'-phosphate decarboxylase
MRDPLIFALDVENRQKALDLVDTIGEAGSFYKIGMELYAAEGMQIVREILDRGKRVFLDLKFYDIPATVERATRRVAETGVSFLTVHSSKAVMCAAAAGANDSGLDILAVTVLTSFDESDLRDLGYPGSVPDLVDLRVRKAVESSVDGIVCSALEVERVRKLAGPGRKLVTPGVRSAGADHGDQKRVATPAEALERGSDYLVIGRQVTRADDPASAVARIREEIASVLEG